MNLDRDKIRPLIPPGVFVAQDVIKQLPGYPANQVEWVIEAMARENDTIERVARYRYCRLEKKVVRPRPHRDHSAAIKPKTTPLETQLRNTVATLRTLQETAKQAGRDTIETDATFALKRLETWI